MTIRNITILFYVVFYHVIVIFDTYNFLSVYDSVFEWGIIIETAFFSNYRWSVRQYHTWQC